MCFSESCKRGSKIQCSLLQLWHYYDSLWVLLHDSKKILEIRPLMKTVKCLDSIFPKWFNQFPLFFNRKEYNYLLRTFCHFQSSLCSSCSVLSGVCLCQTILQVSGRSVLAQVLQDEKWVSMVKKHWHEAPAMMEKSQRGLSSNSASGGKKQRETYGCIFNCLQVDSFLCK